MKNLEFLNLVQNFIIVFPSEICTLTSLKSLFLSDNKLTALPSEIGNLTNLETLDLCNNNLTSLPSEIGNLKCLKDLHVAYNELSALPSEIGNLTNLETLDLNNKDLSYLPSEIGNIKCLKTLYMANNSFNALPSEIGDLASLVYLNAASNYFESIPASIINLDKSLRLLDLSKNYKGLVDRNDTLNCRLTKLRQIFGDRLVYSHLAIPRIQKISLKDAKSRINNQFPHWNMDILKSLIFKTIAPKHSLSFEDLSTIWNDEIRPHILFPDIKDAISFNEAENR